MFALNASTIKAQVLVDKDLKTLFNRTDTSGSDYTKPLRESNNEIDIAVSSVFLFYKTFISSQDMPTCIFTPSCSEYAVQAFRQKGLFIGWLSSFDRLSRCHGLASPEHYHLDMNKKRFYDPVR
jgi:putative component of membrane protein insertase Oxa1/YidC/SpoIIIJ protein YidD